MTFTVPVPGGAMAVIRVLESMVNVVAVVPNRTVNGPTPLNPEPVMMTVLKLAAGPEDGVSEVITGAICLPSIGDQ
nr:hypothetical protein [Nocardia rhamnosiphila]